MIIDRTAEVVAFLAVALTAVTIVVYEIIRRRQDRRIARLEARVARMTSRTPVITERLTIGRPDPVVLTRPTRVDVRGYQGAQR